MDRFSEEMTAFGAMLPGLLATDEGRHAVMLGSELLGIREAYAEALTLGYGTRPDGGFLVARITRVPKVVTLTRDLKAA